MPKQNRSQWIKVIARSGDQRMYLYKQAGYTCVGFINTPLPLWRSLLDQHKSKIPASARFRVRNPEKEGSYLYLECYPQGE